MAKEEQASLGLATTRELIDELASRADVAATIGEKWPSYRTVDGRGEVTAEEGEYLARRFHEAYERLAPYFGYETRTETREFDPASKNGRLMVAVCSELLAGVLTLGVGSNAKTNPEKGVT